MSLQIQLKKSSVSQKQPFPSDLALGELALNYNADGPFLTCKDTDGNVRKINNVWVSATAPSNPSAGDLWLDTAVAVAVLKVYKDSSATWVPAVTIPIATTTVFGTVRLASSTDVTNATAGKVVDAAQLQNKITELLSNDIVLNGDLDIFGDLSVTGTTTTIDTVNLIVEDKNIELGSVDTPSDTTADGGGLTLKGATDKTFNWVNATDSWTSSENINLASGKDYKIAGTKVIDATSLGSAVVSSSLTSLGTVTTGTWSATTIATDKGGTGQTTYTDGQLLIGKTDGTLAKATITPGSGIDVTNADGSITVDVDLKANGGLVIESTELAVDLGASGITGTLAATDGGTGQTSYTNGQLLIGKTDGTLAKNTITAGANVSITNADGAITVASDPGVTSVTATSPLASTGGATPDISIQDGTTTQKGAVQLEDSTSSTSTTTAATPNSVKSAYDLANAALTSSDIGVTVQGYDADTAKYDDTTANFTGTLQNGGSNVLVDTDIGSTVQAYDADTAKLDTTQSFTAAQRGAVTALTPGATVTPDFAVSNNFSLALDQNTTLANPTNIAAGQSGAITITQDSTARTLAYGNYWFFQGGAPTLGTTTGAVSTLVYYADTTTRITAVLINEPAN